LNFYHNFSPADLNWGKACRGPVYLDGTNPVRVILCLIFGLLCVSSGLASVNIGYFSINKLQTTSNCKIEPSK